MSLTDSSQEDSTSTVPLEAHLTPSRICSSTLPDSSQQFLSQRSPATGTSSFSSSSQSGLLWHLQPSKENSPPPIAGPPRWPRQECSSSSSTQSRSSSRSCSFS